MACRLNLAARNFDKAAENLQHAAQFRRSGERLRQVVEDEGQAVPPAAAAGRRPLDWDARDGPAHDQDGPETGQARRDLGSDGVKVPRVTPAEKDARRARVKDRSRRRGPKGRPRARAGADQRSKEFQIVTAADDLPEHRLVSVTRGDHAVAGRWMRRDGGRVGPDRADDKVAVVEGADGIRHPLHQQSRPWEDSGRDCSPLADDAHTTQRAGSGEDDPADRTAPGTSWVAGIRHTAKHQGDPALRAAWVGGKATRRGPQRRPAAAALIG
jgi:hypothetical protein